MDRLCTVLVATLTAGAYVAPAALAATPTSYLEYAAIVGVGQTLTLTRLPVLAANGRIVYKDVTIQLAIGPAGQVTYAAAEPVVTNSPAVVVSTIKPGLYEDSDSGSAYEFTITGPGVLTAGASEYTIINSSNGCAVAQPGVFYSGPPSASPIAARVKAAGIDTDQYRVGETGSESCYPGYSFYSNGLFGLSQVGNTLIVASFTDSSGKDYAMPVGQRTYLFQQ